MSASDADVSIVSAIIMAGLAEQDLVDYVAKPRDFSNALAHRILNLGYRLRDDDLERRVAQLEKWTRGEFA